MMPIHYEQDLPSVAVSELEKQRHALSCFGDGELASARPDGQWQNGFRCCLKGALEMFDELIAKATPHA